jgi:hypothetical protein
MAIHSFEIFLVRTDGRIFYLAVREDAQAGLACSMRKEVTGELRKPHNEELHDLCFSPDIGL